ncbi:hypothetical protein [Nocardiopsis sp. MG754419]|uniref:hypothetical protein n=1 Tax=Nocardiopsis sp. MG754419 TaxID=2259865 RepID=UPI001BA6AE28|nr:hypothetical protein [Nocardiopsis sp. MG754419]MBR8742841.1 hypothetical protein [Nocardiopsis sp. MG754419]
MSTSPEDTKDTTPTSDPSPETGSDPAEASAGEAFVSAAPEPRKDGLFGPETFSVAGLLLLATTLLSTELIAIVNQHTLTGAQGTLSAAVQGQLTGAGLFAGLAVVSAAVALLRADASTRPWARHLAAATVLVGLLLVVLTVASYALLTT